MNINTIRTIIRRAQIEDRRDRHDDLRSRARLYQATIDASFDRMSTTMPHGESPLVVIPTDEPRPQCGPSDAPMQCDHAAADADSPPMAATVEPAHGFPTLDAEGRNPYTVAAKEARNEEWARYLEANPPVTRDQWTGRGPSVWTTVPDGRGGTLSVRSGGPERRAFREIHSRHMDAAAERSLADRLAAGWYYGDDGRIRAPNGARVGVSGMPWGRFATVDAWRNDPSMWGDALRQSGG